MARTPKKSPPPSAAVPPAVEPALEDGDADAVAVAAGDDAEADVEDVADEVVVDEVVVDEVVVDEVVVDDEVVAGVEVEADEADEAELDEEKSPAPRPARPSPGRPPGAKEEPDPPYYPGERVRLTSNTRPRTNVPIGVYPVGAEATVETVLSLTCIVRFDLARDIKEVVAFTCLDSIDDDAKARRAERDRLKAAAAILP